LHNEKNINLDQTNCLQPLKIPDVEYELVPPPCASANQIQIDSPADNKQNI